MSADVVTATFSGRVRKFGDGIDTDIMYPGSALRMDPGEAATHLFEALVPGWSETVQRGDVIVGGKNFGIGSGRPVGTLFHILGIRIVLADSISSLFQRNCINAGLYALAVPGLPAACEEGDVITVDVAGGLAEVNGTQASFSPPPPFLRRIVDAGGVLNLLMADGYLEPQHST